MNHYNLYLEICKNTVGTSPFFTVLSQIRQANDPALLDILDQLKFPEDLCINQTSKHLSDYDTEDLNSKDPLFSSINELILTLKGLITGKQCSERVVPNLKKLIEIYENYIRDVCSCRGEKRYALLIGKARLFIQGNKA